MAQRKAFLLRLPEGLLDELSRWARDDLRSVNAQMEYLLRDAVRRRAIKLVPESPDESPDQPRGDNSTHQEPAT